MVFYNLLTIRELRVSMANVCGILYGVKRGFKGRGVLLRWVRQRASLIDGLLLIRLAESRIMRRFNEKFLIQDK